MSRSRPAASPLSFHKSTGQYYVTRNRKRIHLGADPDEALKEYHRLSGPITGISWRYDERTPSG